MDIRELPNHVSPELFRKLANDLVKAFKSGDPVALQSLQDHFKPRNPLTWVEVRKGLKKRTLKLANSRIRNKSKTLLNLLRLLLKKLLLELKIFDLKDAQLVIANEYGFNNFHEFEKYILDINNPDSTVSIFESAVDALVSGNFSTLEKLILENPGLIRTRSNRIHQATLLHYMSANGVEDFRQKTPKNGVTIMKFLLTAGADVDAVLADKESTTLGLVATSVHPLVAGVQNEMLEVLLDAGASVDGIPGGWNPLTAALSNGRGMAAEFLANHGARLDLEGAAGVGQLNVVKNFFQEDGSLKPNATKTQLMSGFAWACEYGKTNVVEFLLQKGVDVNSLLRHSGQSGLHWAAFAGNIETVKLLLQKNANINLKDKSFGGTPLGWALYGWGENTPEFKTENYYKVVELLVAAGATVKSEWLADPDRELPLVEKIHTDPRMLVALKAIGNGQ